MENEKDRTRRLAEHSRGGQGSLIESFFPGLPKPATVGVCLAAAQLICLVGFMQFRDKLWLKNLLFLAAIACPVLCAPDGVWPWGHRAIPLGMLVHGVLAAVGLDVLGYLFYPGLVKEMAVWSGDHFVKTITVISVVALADCSIWGTVWLLRVLCQRACEW